MTEHVNKACFFGRGTIERQNMLSMVMDDVDPTFTSLDTWCEALRTTEDEKRKDDNINLNSGKGRTTEDKRTEDCCGLSNISWLGLGQRLWWLCKRFLQELWR